MVTSQFCIIVLVVCATIHIVLASVLALYARYRVQYLSLTWIMAIFGFALIAVSPFSDVVVYGQPGLFHPLMLLCLTAASFLQSIYPLCFPMPAYLQWGRMWQYALPAIVLYTLYILLWSLGMELKVFHSFGDFVSLPFNGEILLRIVAILLSIYYVVNVLRLPQRLAHSTNVPRYVRGYCSVLILSLLLYLVCTVYYNSILLLSYVLIFTMLNAYLSYRTLETMAESLPKPVIETVEEEPSEEQIEKAEREDFNEANRQHFRRVEYWMQNHKERWTESTFNRDQLCTETGLNRHLLLQCVRSQGYNDIHEYLNTYRIDELKRLIQRGKVRAVSESSDAGFGTPKTARTVFLKMQGESLDDFILKYKEGRDSDDKTE